MRKIDRAIPDQAKRLFDIMAQAPAVHRKFYRWKPGETLVLLRSIALRNQALFVPEAVTPGKFDSLTAHRKMCAKV